MIVETKTGLQFEVCFKALTKKDVSKYGLTKRNGWSFTWSKIFQDEHNRVFGMFRLGDNKNILGALAIVEDHNRALIHIELVEAAPHCKTSASPQIYKGIGIHLLCFAMDYSLKRYHNFEGYVGLIAKLNINETYYEKLGAKLANVFEGQPYYFFDTESSQNLVNTYYPGGVTICPNQEKS
ncbi:hypothetical protein UACE39S_00967 [Ureibacillus acetophenoni]|uniref:hypothetical protein n=1 Tax=Ureibacillus sp. MALMAid1270 TaxID=3411629 RepID=UPI003BA7F9FD